MREAVYPSGRTILALLALWTGVRVLAAWRTPVISGDGTVFGRMARDWAEGRAADALAYGQHPLHGAILAPGVALAGSMHAGGQAAAIAFSLLTFAVALRLGAAMDARTAAPPDANGVRLAVWIPLLAAGWPQLVRWTANIVSEPTFATFSLAGLGEAWAAAIASDPARGRRAAARAGVWFALAHLTRMEGFFLPAATAAAFGWLAIRRALPARRAIALAAIVAATFGAGVFPYVAYLRHETGGWRLSRKKDLGYFLAESVRRWFERPEAPHEQNPSPVPPGPPPSPPGQTPTDHPPGADPGVVDPNVPPHTAREAVERVARWSAQMAGAAGIALATLALARVTLPSVSRAARRATQPDASAAWGALAASAFAIHAAACAALLLRSNYLERRHALLAAVPLLPWAAQAACAACAGGSRAARLAVTALAAASLVAAADRDATPGRVALRTCGERLAREAGRAPDALLVSGRYVERIAFYAGAKPSFFVMSSGEDFSTAVDRLAPALVLFEEGRIHEERQMRKFRRFLSRVEEPDAEYVRLAADGLPRGVCIFLRRAR